MEIYEPVVHLGLFFLYSYDSQDTPLLTLIATNLYTTH